MNDFETDETMDNCPACTSWKGDDCKPNNVQPPHECPFAMELQADATPCTCCDECTTLCTMEI